MLNVDASEPLSPEEALYTNALGILNAEGRQIGERNLNCKVPIPESDAILVLQVKERDMHGSSIVRVLQKGKAEFINIQADGSTIEFELGNGGFRLSPATPSLIGEMSALVGGASEKLFGDKV